jgi:hypothetical protein
MQRREIGAATPWTGQTATVGLAALIVALVLEIFTPPHLACGGRRSCIPSEYFPHFARRVETGVSLGRR